MIKSKTKEKERLYEYIRLSEMEIGRGKEKTGKIEVSWLCWREK